MNGFDRPSEISSKKNKEVTGQEFIFIDRWYDWLMSKGFTRGDLGSFRHFRPVSRTGGNSDGSRGMSRDDGFLLEFIPMKIGAGMTF